MPKRVQSIHVSAIDFFDCPYVDFDGFKRGNSPYQKLNEKLQLMKEEYVKKNLYYLAETLNPSIRRLKDLENYQGFNKISLVECATILAKRSNAQVREESIYVEFCESFCEFNPKVYPLDDLKDIASEATFEHVGLFDCCVVVVNSLDCYDDKEALKKGVSHGLLLGEKNGDFYFINYFQTI